MVQDLTKNWPKKRSILAYVSILRTIFRQIWTKIGRSHLHGEWLRKVLIYLVLALTGFAAGFIDTIAGGGGMITLPAYLMAGLPPHIALGTNKLSGALSVGNAARIFIKKKIFYPRYWQPAIIATFCGGLAGSTLVHFLSGAFLKRWLPIIILTLAVYVAVPKKYSASVQPFYRPKAVTQQHHR